MNNDQNLQLTDLDYLVGDHHLQMMKAALPYVNIPEQRVLSTLVKFHELRRTIQLFDDKETATLGICALGEKPATPIDMLNAMKPFANTHEQDSINLITNLLQTFHQPNQTTQEASTGNTQTGNPFSKLPIEQLKNFLPVEQQSRLETMQLLISTLQMF